MAPSVPEKFGGFSSSLHQKGIKFQEAIFINGTNYPAILLILFQSKKKLGFEMFSKEKSSSIIFVQNDFALV